MALIELSSNLVIVLAAFAIMALARTNRQRFEIATWLLPLAVLFLVGLWLFPGFAGVAAMSVAVAGIAVMLTLDRPRRLWSRHIVRSNDPWLLHPVGEPEVRFVTGLLDQLSRGHKAYLRLARGTGTERDVQVIRDAAVRAAALPATSDGWKRIQTKATSVLERSVAAAERLPITGVFSDETDLADRWGELLTDIHTARREVRRPDSSSNRSPA